MNWDLSTIVLPVRASVLKQMLLKAGYPDDKIDFLYHGFTRGFLLGYRGPKKVHQFAHNL